MLFIWVNPPKGAEDQLWAAHSSRCWVPMEMAMVQSVLKEFRTGLFFTLTYFHVRVCGTVSHSSCAKVSGQTMEVSFSFHHVGPRTATRLLGGLVPLTTKLLSRPGFSNQRMFENWGRTESGQMRLLNKTTTGQSKSRIRLYSC